MREDQAAEKERDEVEDTPSPAPEQNKTFRDTDGGDQSKQKDYWSVAATNSTEATLHGVPLTISKCKFQAHIARIGSVQEARAVCKAVSSQIAQEAGFSEYVCPFAFRLSCNVVLKAPRRLEASPREAPVADDESTGDVTHEGFCDNGDVGSGEKLLYLLQRRGLRHIVLVVSRINGGFMMAELLGIRRHEKKHQTQGYKFVVDRAKRLLESGDLPSLRQVLDADSNPANTADDSVELLYIHDAAGHGRHEPSCRVPEYCPDGQGGWDNFAMPGSERQPFFGHTQNGSPIERQAAGGVVAPQGLHGDQSKGCSQTNEKKAGAKVTAGTRQRQSLSLAQLRISPEAVLPQRHVPSVMGDKGYGTKRGRINHFEFPTPPSTPGRSGDATTVDVGRYVGYGASDSSDSRDACHLIPRAAEWSHPRRHDPTSAPSRLQTGGRDMSAHGDTGGKEKRISLLRTLENYRDRHGSDWSTLGTTSSATTNSATTRFAMTSSATTSSATTTSTRGRITAAVVRARDGISKDLPLHPLPPFDNALWQRCRGNDSKVPHCHRPSKVGVTDHKSGGELFCCQSPEITSHISSAGGGGGTNHLAPPGASLGITAEPRAEVPRSLSSKTHGGDGNCDGTGFSCQTLSSFKIMPVNLPTSGENPDFFFPTLESDSNANGLQLPAIGSTT